MRMDRNVCALLTTSDVKETRLPGVGSHFHAGRHTTLEKLTKNPGMSIGF